MDEMSEADVNCLEFPRDKFENDTQLFAAVASFLQLLEKMEQIAVVHSDGFTVTVEYNPADPAFGKPTPAWVYEDEFEIEEIDNEY